jgi:hypothetical protein
MQPNLQLNHYCIVYNGSARGTPDGSNMNVNYVKTYINRVEHSVTPIYDTDPFFGFPSGSHNPATSFRIGTEKYFSNQYNDTSNFSNPVPSTGRTIMYAPVNINDFIIFRNTLLANDEVDHLYNYRSDYSTLNTKLGSKWSNRIAHYSFDNTLNDISGNGNHLTAVNSPSFIDISL